MAAVLGLPNSCLKAFALRIVGYDAMEEKPCDGSCIVRGLAEAFSIGRESCRVRVAVADGIIEVDTVDLAKINSFATDKQRRNLHSFRHPRFHDSRHR